MKVRSEEELSDRLAGDLIWRKKELTTLKKLLSVASVDRRAVLCRSVLAILYAHWEGFIKNASYYYVQYLTTRRLRYSEVTSNFVALGLMKRLREAASRSNPSEMIDVIELFRGGSDGRFRATRDDINTESNLSSRVLRSMTTYLGLDYSPFEMRALLIDERLLDNRNKIAHGEYLSLEPADTIELVGEITALLESFRDQIENAAALSSYRNTNVACSNKSTPA